MTIAVKLSEIKYEQFLCRIGFCRNIRFPFFFVDLSYHQNIANVLRRLHNMLIMMPRLRAFPIVESNGD